MIRAVLDVNVLASAFPRLGGTPAAVVLAALRGDFVIVVSDTMLDRLVDTWQKPYVRSRFSDANVVEALERIRVRAEFVVPAADVRGVADDLEDDLVLATAVAGNATYLVTGDRGLLERDGYRGLTLATPAAFRLVLEQPETAVRR